MQPLQNLSEFKLPPGFRGRSAFHVQLWWIIHSTLFRLSPQFMYGWRVFLLRIFGAKIGRHVLVRPSARITYPWKLSIGDFSWIGDYVELYNLGNIYIGNNVVISQHAYLCTGSHDFQVPSFDIFERPIVVQDEAWVASGVFIYPGVTVGRGAVIAARSVLRSDAEEMLVYAGSPAVPARGRLRHGKK